MMKHILLHAVALWFAMASLLFADGKELEFIKAVHDVIQKGEAEGIKGISLEAPTDEQLINRFFMPKGLTLNEVQVIGVDEAKEKWEKAAIRLVDSLNEVKAEDELMRLSWSNKREGAGQIDVIQYFVVTIVDGQRKLRLK